MAAQAHTTTLRTAALAALHDSAIYRVARRCKCRRLASLAAAINTAAAAAEQHHQRGMTNFDTANKWRLASLAAPTDVTDCKPTPYQRRTNAVSNAHTHTAATRAHKKNYKTGGRTGAHLFLAAATIHIFTNLKIFQNHGKI